MSQSLIEEAPDVIHLITEDDAPMDNLPSEKQQRLLTEALYSSWSGPGEDRSFLVAANVGIFSLARGPAIVPDVFLSLDVEIAEDWWQKEHRSYFIWEFGKPPEVAIEIVSNKEGNEDGEKEKEVRPHAGQLLRHIRPVATGNARGSDRLSAARLRV
ncbi:MAG: Uma2 family endonuclease [Pyrinomonadaceae bacterium]